MRKLRFLFLGLALTAAAFAALPAHAIPFCTGSTPYTCFCTPGHFKACTADAWSCTAICPIVIGPA